MIIAAQSSKGRGPAANNGPFVTGLLTEGKRLKQSKSPSTTIVWEVSHVPSGLEGQKTALDQVKLGFYSAWTIRSKGLPMRPSTRLLCLAGLLALPLAACNQTATTAPASTSVTPSGFSMPTGTGCQGEVARYRAVMSNDLAMGHVGQSVYNRVDREIDQAEAACTAGRDADAVRMINATKRRHGYV